MLTVGPHDRIGISGPNGTGKTTLVRTLLRTIAMREQYSGVPLPRLTITQNTTDQDAREAMRRLTALTPIDRGDVLSAFAQLNVDPSRLLAGGNPSPGELRKLLLCLGLRDHPHLPEISEHGVKVMSSNLLLQNETDPVLWRGPVIAGAIRQFWSETSWGPIDYLLVDMPPGTGDVALTVFQSLPVDGIVIVTSPQDLVSMIVAKAVNMAEKMNVPILGIVENMSYIECPDCGKKIEVFGKSKLPEVAERYNLDILGQLPINPSLAEACDKGEVETALPDGMLPKAVSAVEAIAPHKTDEA